MTRRTLPTLLLAALLSLSLLTPAAAAARFSDVPASAWYASDVQDVQQYGILQGVGSNRFLPQGILTYAQAITMAAQTDAYLHHKTLPSGSASPWYQPYVDYALDEGLIEEHDLPWSLDAACTRESMAQLFYAIVDGDQLSIRNSVDNIPDVPYEPRTASIYQLYRFGILTGSDAYGTFHPDQSITRAEAAAILNRLFNTPPNVRPSPSSSPPPCSPWTSPKPGAAQSGSTGNNTSPPWPSSPTAVSTACTTSPTPAFPCPCAAPTPLRGTPCV